MEELYHLYCADCIKKLKDFPENTFDMIFADPPYLLSNGGISCQNGKVVSVNKGDWDESKGLKNDFKFHKKWLSACRRVLKPNGTIWISGTYHSIYACGFAMQLLGYHILNDIAWFKPNASQNLSCRYFTASHETLIWARKDKKNYKISGLVHRIDLIEDGTEGAEYYFNHKRGAAVNRVVFPTWSEPIWAEFHPTEIAKGITQPYLLVIGENAFTRPGAEKMFDNIASKDKQKIIIPQARHFDMYDGENYAIPAINAINDFLQKRL